MVRRYPRLPRLTRVKRFRVALVIAAVVTAAAVFQFIPESIQAAQQSAAAQTEAVPRPENKMAAFCDEHGITLLPYGALLGGLMAEKYVARPEPRRSELSTASLQKYRNMIEAWGGWSLFQELLAAVKQIADRHQVSIANVAVRAILHRPAVAAVIVGTRLGLA